MTRIYKISIFLSMITLVLVISNFAMAQGKGYFLEKGKELFIFDSIYINGYLIVEEDLSEQKGALGDVLVEKEFILDEESSFYFCKNEIDPITLLKGNRFCTNRVMIWHPEADLGLEVVNQAVFGTSLYQINVSKIIAGNGSSNINFVAANTKNIITYDQVKINGCFSNDGSETCTTNNLKTTKLYLDNNNSLFALNSRGGQKGLDEIILNPKNANFAKIDLGPEENIDNQNLCWKVGRNASCYSANGGISFYKNRNFISPGGTYGLSENPDQLVCCYLCVDTFRTDCSSAGDQFEGGSAGPGGSGSPSAP